jgi:hypothetical protein
MQFRQNVSAAAPKARIPAEGHDPAIHWIGNQLSARNSRPDVLKLTLCAKQEVKAVLILQLVHSRWFGDLCEGRSYLTNGGGRISTV